ncbi:MAG: hypothetical protein NVSMB17_12410 [Candidatus Dormibacteria bacterium]
MKTVKVRVGTLLGLLLSTLSLFFGAGAAMAAGTSPGWTQARPASAPSPRFGTASTYDSVRHQVVVFGGYDFRTGFHETWTWDGSTWTKHTPVTSPPDLAYAGMAFNPTTGTAILFGGTPQNYTPARDTWSWDGTNWTRLTPAASPSPRFSFGMAYDSALSKVVLFGGDGGNTRGNHLNDTWTFDGSTWAMVATGESPAVRYSPAMTYDAARGTILMFGGITCPANCPDYVTLDDTWTFDGTRWTQLHPRNVPGSRSGSQAWFEPAAARTVMFGGVFYASGAETYLSDTWLWDGTNWMIQPPTAGSPGKRSLAALAFDTQAGSAVLFGGLDRTTSLGDTWSFRAPPPPTHGYNMLTGPGGIYSFGDATYWGNLIDHGYPGPAVGLSEMPDGSGYHILTGAGGIYSFGTANGRYYGNLIDHGYPGPATALGVTNTGDGYAILTSGGGFYSFGDAQGRYYGNLIDHGYPGRAVSFAWTGSGRGYWILTDAGAIYSFGDAMTQYHGNLLDHGYPGHAVSLARSAGGDGYLILTGEGGLYTFGDAALDYRGNLIDHRYPGPGVALSTTP